ncbi:MAG: hypothetical protein ACOY99_05550, partial [Pseudomonadota bacterium]
WWTIGFGLAAYLASMDGDLTAALVFAAVFGIVFGGGMQAIKRAPPPKRARKRPARPMGRLIRPRESA